jgi:hypothetical protein
MNINDITKETTLEEIDSIIEKELEETKKFYYSIEDIEKMGENEKKEVITKINRKLKYVTEELKRELLNIKENTNKLIGLSKQ